MNEEKSRKLPFENYFESLSEFIKTRNDKVNRMIPPGYSNIEFYTF